MRHLGLDGADGVVPDITAGPTVSGSFVSPRRLGARCGWTIGYPPGSRPGAPLPVLVSLHGRSADHTTSFGTGLHLERFLAQAVARGVPEFAVASIDGGDTYWHQRSDGEDAGAMVTEEFLPLLGAHGLRTSRLGFLGWSMGGYGALHLAGLLGRARVRAVGVMSPALWHTAGETPQVPSMIPPTSRRTPSSAGNSSSTESASWSTAAPATDGAPAVGLPRLPALSMAARVVQRQLGRADLPHA
jgi:S-formylglutathione hydrolase FrmB